jgi:hypothetical protein
MKVNDEEAAEFYSNPENLQPVGPPRRRSGGRALSSHVPVRFSPSLVQAVKAIADLEGVSVSTWIRSLVIREVERRRPPVTTTVGSSELDWEQLPPPAQTVSSGAQGELLSV